jgi:Fic family protein
MIYSTPSLHDSELSTLQEIESTMVKLRHSMSAPKRWQGVLRRNTFARAIRGSNSIEGYNVSKEDALAAVDGEQPLDAEKETWLAVSGYRNAMTYVLQLANDPHFVYSEGLIKGLHFMMLQYDLAKHPGTWRPGSIFVRDDTREETVYEGPDVDSVPQLMSELMKTLNDTDGVPPIVRAAMGHLNLVMIHPFSDGNGRMARCLQTLILARSGVADPRFCSIEEYLGRNTQDYYNILAYVGQGGWHPENDARPWIRFCLIAHYNQAQTILRRTREIERIWDELEALILKRGFPDRVIFALSDAALGYRIRNSSYRAVADINDAMASRDLKLLVQAGLLLPDGEKRGRIYAGSDELKAIRLRNREPRPNYKQSYPEDMFLPGMDPT